MDWSIQQIARLAGTTSRTLRHYDDIGLLAPTRVAANGYRHYDEAALVRLQRILLLRELDVPLPQIAGILDRPTTEEQALTTHLAWLRQEQQRLTRQIASVASTIERMRGGEQLMAEDMFDGFDHTQYRDEVEERWGGDAYARSDSWWRGLGADGQADWKARAARLHREWAEVAQSGAAPDSAEAQAVAEHHVQWLRGIPGTPAAQPDGDVAGYVRGLGEMYVADPRFSANYGGEAGAAFVRDALCAWAERTR